MSHALRRRWAALIEDLKKQKKVLVAYSAGCDSTFLLSAARHALPRENLLAVTAISPSLASYEKELAEALANKIDAPHTFLETNEMQNPSYASNPSNRCFFCKDELYSKLAPLAAARGMKIADGLNVSDLRDYRPGVRAAEKWGVMHPLKDAGLTKKEIRALSRWLGLSTWQKPASPCLASRIPYGTAVTEEILKQIEQAERFLMNEKFRIVRVRHYGTEARIEVPPADIPVLKGKILWARIETAFRAIGFTEISVDSRGFQSGRLNEGIEKAPLLRSEMPAHAF